MRFQPGKATRDPYLWRFLLAEYAEDLESLSVDQLRSDLACPLDHELKAALVRELNRRALERIR